MNLKASAQAEATRERHNMAFSISRRGFLSVAALTAGASVVSSCASAKDSKGTEGSVTQDAGDKVDHSKVSGHIVVLSTGGTIASTADASGALVPTVSGPDLVEPLYDSFDKNKLTLEVKEIAQLDSSAMTLEDTDNIVRHVREALAREDVDGVIVTHGTDSMEESAIAVDTFIDGEKPVVLTGAMRPFDDPDPDGPANLALAVETVTNPQNKGAFIAFGGTVLPARGAYKSHTEHADGFSTNGGERPKGLDFKPMKDVRVDIIAAYPGAPGDLIEASVKTGAQGLVIEGMGAGNIGSSLADAAIKAAATIPVVLSTRVDAGPVSGVYGGAGGGATLGEKGIISSGTLRAGQSRILVAAAVATGTEAKALFDAP